MSVRSAQSVTIEFTTSSPTTGAAANADSTPTGTLILNGADNAASVTVTNIDTGRYKAAVTLPTLAVSDIVELLISATVGGTASKAIVWRDTKDLVYDSSGNITGNLSGSVGSVSSAVTVTGKPSVTLAAADVTGNLPVDVQTIKTQTVTCASGVTVLASVGTASTSTAQTGDAYARLGAPSGASIAADIATRAPSSTALSTAQWTNTRAGYLDNLSGGAVALASGVNLASTGLDAVIVETGLTAKQALQYMSAACFGVISGAGTGTVVIKAGANSGTTRITAATDSSGNRTSVTLA